MQPKPTRFGRIDTSDGGMDTYSMIMSVDDLGSLVHWWVQYMSPEPEPGTEQDIRNIRNFASVDSTIDIV